MTVETCRIHTFEPSPGARDGAEAWACTDCPATSAQCVEGEHPTGSAIPLCERCRQRVTDWLTQIETYLDLAARYALSVSPVRSPMDYTERVGGGRGGDAEEPAEQVAAIAGVMWEWAAMWTEHTPGTTAEPGHWRPLLSSMLIWAATQPETSAWLDFVTEVRSARTRARAIAGLEPVRMSQRCMYCTEQGHRGELVRDRCDDRGRPYPDGLQDEVRCLTCDHRWDDEQHYQLVVRQRLTEAVEREPDATVTLDQARQVWPEVPAQSWKDWVRRGLLTETEGGGYRVADVRERVTLRSAPTRHGRRLG